MWPGEGLTYITYHRNAAHLFILALTVHTGGHSVLSSTGYCLTYICSGKAQRLSNVEYQI